jgi:predicted O-methyltransferase YrrM
MSTAEQLRPVFDDSHHAATLIRKVWRAAQLGPVYYFWDLPRYFAHRRNRNMPLWDGGVFTNPLREFRPGCRITWEMPPGYDETLREFARLGLQLTIPRPRLEALVRAWWRTRDVLGEVIECGAYKGATSLLLALLGRHNGIGQKVLILDTFAGMPEVSGYDLARRPGEFRPPEDQAELIRRQAEALGVADRVEVHKGLFNDTFAVLGPRDLQFAFVHIDANIYQGTLDACTFTIPRVSPGGVVVFDDYNGVCDLGARLAIDEYLAGRGLRPKPLAASSAYVRLPGGRDA